MKRRSKFVLPLFNGFLEDILPTRDGGIRQDIYCCTTTATTNFVQNTDFLSILDTLMVNILSILDTLMVNILSILDTVMVDALNRLKCLHVCLIYYIGLHTF